LGDTNNNCNIFLLGSRALLLGLGLSFSRQGSVDRGSARRKAPTYTSMRGVGFEPTISEFKRVKTVHALGRADNTID
jgi:hypothetical protein